MALDKAILHGKEHRKQYRKAGRYDSTCRPGGSCPYCLGNRMHGTEKAKIKAESTKEEVEWERD